MFHLHTLWLSQESTSGHWFSSVSFLPRAVGPPSLISATPGKQTQEGGKTQETRGKLHS